MARAALSCAAATAATGIYSRSVVRTDTVAIADGTSACTPAYSALNPGIGLYWIDNYNVTAVAVRRVVISYEVPLLGVAAVVFPKLDFIAVKSPVVIEIDDIVSIKRAMDGVDISSMMFKTP